MTDGRYRVAVALGRMLLRALDLETRVDGAEHIPRDGPVIVAANHVAYPDAMTIVSEAQRRGRYLRFLTRHDVWHLRLIGPAMTAMGHVPVDREVPAAAYLTARRLLREGEAVGIFPEAGISFSYAVRSLMPGAVALAKETGAPIVPVAQWGIQRVWSVNRTMNGRPPPPSLRRGRRNDLRFGPPIVVPPDGDVGEWTNRLGILLTTMVEELQRLPHHQPRAGEYAPWHPAHLGGHAPDSAEAATLDSVPRSAIPPTWGPWHPSGH